MGKDRVAEDARAMAGNWSGNTLRVCRLVAELVAAGATSY